MSEELEGYSDEEPSDDFAEFKREVRPTREKYGRDHRKMLYAEMRESEKLPGANTAVPTEHLPHLFSLVLQKLKDEYGVVDIDGYAVQNLLVVTAVDVGKGKSGLTDVTIQSLTNTIINTCVTTVMSDTHSRYRRPVTSLIPEQTLGQNDARSVLARYCALMDAETEKRGKSEYNHSHVWTKQDIQKHVTRIVSLLTL